MISIILPSVDYFKNISAVFGHQRSVKNIKESITIILQFNNITIVLLTGHNIGDRTKKPFAPSLLLWL